MLRADHSLRPFTLPAILALCLGLSPVAQAIEKFNGVRLPGSALGSTATEVVLSKDTGVYSVVGYDTNGDGTADGVWWGVAAGDVTGDGPVEVLTAKLPEPPGADSVATGVAMQEGDPDRPVIVGNVRTANGGIWRATLWIQGSGNGFTNTTLDDEASQATAVAVRQDGSGIITACGWRQLANGNRRACMHSAHRSAGPERAKQRCERALVE
jgi:hypothetical protein